LTLSIHEFTHITVYPTSTIGKGDSIYYSFSTYSIHLRHRRAKLNQDFLDIPRLAPYYSSHPIADHNLCSAIYCGLIFPHYGHFLSESIHRLWPIDRLPSNLPLLFIPLSTDLYSIDSISRNHRYIIEFFALLDIPLERIHILTEPISVSQLYVPSQASYLGPRNQISRSYIDILNNRQKLFFSAKFTSIPRLAVYRPNINRPGARGSIAGQRCLYMALSNVGFYCTDMLNLPLSYQVDLLSSCSDLVITESSAIHTLELFGTIHSRVTILHRGGYPSRQLKSYIKLLRSRKSYYRILKSSFVFPPIQFIVNHLGRTQLNRRLAISVLSPNSLSKLIREYHLDNSLFLLYYIASIRDILFFVFRELCHLFLFCMHFIPYLLWTITLKFYTLFSPLS